MHKARKSKAFKKDVNKIAQLEAEVALLRAEVAKLKKAPCASKVLDDYRKKMYNEMVDTLVELKKRNHSEVYK